MSIGVVCRRWPSPIPPRRWDDGAHRQHLIHLSRRTMSPSARGLWPRSRRQARRALAIPEVPKPYRGWQPDRGCDGNHQYDQHAHPPVSSRWCAAWSRHVHAHPRTSNHLCHRPGHVDRAKTADRELTPSSRLRWRPGSPRSPSSTAEPRARPSSSGSWPSGAPITPAQNTEDTSVLLV